MIKCFKIYLILLLVALITGCSYKPILSKKNYEFSIEKVEFKGDKEVNYFIEKRLKNLKNSKYSNKYYLQIENSKLKNIISKDTKGDPSKLEIIIISNFKISNSEKLLLEKKLKVKNNYNNISDKLQLRKYESIIIENLSDKISDNIISIITNINDN
tara:strand:- start:1222 stop:1692 length:471 start_codon:yes stop_codon:yes gene_type:complete